MRRRPEIDGSPRGAPSRDRGWSRRTGVVAAAAKRIESRDQLRAAVMIVLVYRRVPLFLYVLHLYPAHALAVVLATATGFGAASLLDGWSVSATWSGAIPKRRG